MAVGIFAVGGFFVALFGVDGINAVSVVAVGVGIGEGEGGGFMVASGGGEFEGTGEDFEVEAEGVVGGHEGDEEADDAQDGSISGVGGEGGVEDFIFGPETGEGEDAGESEAADEHGDVGDGHDFADAGHFADVEFAAHGVHDGTCGEEQEGFEEGVGEDVKDGSAGGLGVVDGAEAEGEEHVAELGEGGVGPDFFEVVLAEGDGGGEEGGEAADAGDDVEGEVVIRVHEEEGHGAGDEVNARGDHGCGVDEGGDGGGAFHGVRQPDMEGELGGFAEGAEHQAEGDVSEDGAEGRERNWVSASLAKTAVYWTVPK